MRVRQPFPCSHRREEVDSGHVRGKQTFPCSHRGEEVDSGHVRGKQTFPCSHRHKEVDSDHALQQKRNTQAGSFAFQCSRRVITTSQLVAADVSSAQFKPFQTPESPYPLSLTPSFTKVLPTACRLS